MRIRTLASGVGIALAAPAAALAGNSAIFVEDFNNGFAGWGGGGGNTYMNPQSGGVGGVDDGYFTISREFDGMFAARSFADVWNRDYIADGVTSGSLWLNNLGTDDGLEIHVGFGYSFAFFQYNEPFVPTDDWTEFTFDFTDPSKWTDISLFGGSFEDALQNADRLLIRHDPLPFAQISQGPDPISGDLGIDRISLIPAPSTAAALLAGAGLVSTRRRR